MRIIAGRFKGHQLVAFKADHIRPTTDRVKETLFNKLQFDIDGAQVLDLFCGTGNLGLEAISRGAVFCTFVEKNPKSLTIARQNIEKLRVEKNLYKIVSMDVLAFLRSYNEEPVDIIFADPPFTEKMAHDVMEAAAQSKAFGAHTILAIESAAKERMESEYAHAEFGDLERFDYREYGDKILSFFRRKIPANEGEI